jgi:glutathione S-transferase
MTTTITAFEQSPDRGRGLARDMRVRWALEEVGQPYEVRLLSFGAMKAPDHLARHPFGQIPTYEEGDLTLFESGATFCTSRSATRACCLTRRAPGRVPSPGCSPR